MSIFTKTFVSFLTALFLLGAVAACDDNDGPAEQAGEAIDDAAEDVGDAVEDATD